MFLTVESETMPMVEAPVCDLVCRRVALDRDGPLRRDEHTPDTFGNESAQKVVHRQEGQPKAEFLDDAEDIDLVGLVDGQFIEQSGRRVHCLEPSLPRSSSR